MEVYLPLCDSILCNPRKLKVSLNFKKVTKRILKALRFFNLHEFQKHYGHHVEALAPLIKEMKKLKKDRNVHR